MEEKSPQQGKVEIINPFDHCSDFNLFQNIAENQYFFTENTKDRQKKNIDQNLVDFPELKFLTDLSRLLIGSDLCIACCFDNQNERLLISGNHFGEKEKESQEKDIKAIIEKLKTLNFSEKEENFDVFIKSVFDHLHLKSRKEFKEIDDFFKDLMVWYFKGVDPSNVTFLMKRSISDDSRRFIEKYVEGFYNVIKSKEHLEKLKKYKVEYIHNDKLGVHAEIKVLEKLVDDYKGKITNFTFCIGTSLRTCAHCEMIYQIVENDEKLRHLDIKRRTSHGNFYEYSREQEIPKIIQENNLTKVYLEKKGELNKVKKENKLDSSNTKQFGDFQNKDLKDLKVNANTKKIMCEFISNFDDCVEKVNCLVGAEKLVELLDSKFIEEIVDAFAKKKKSDEK